MRLQLLKLLACPACRGDLECRKANGEQLSEDHIENNGSEEIEEGQLKCAPCSASFPITRGIPRFVPDDDYAGSFGYQWNRFRLEQIDAHNATSASARRLWDETGWEPDLNGEWILDAGCGAGRFLEAAAKSGAQVVGVDISHAIDAARKTLGNQPNVHFVQASILDLPFKPGVFDRAYCIGVIQHTPDPHGAMEALVRPLKDGGHLAVTIYERKRHTLLAGKYLVRPLTKRLPRRLLLRLIQAGMPLGFAATEILFRIPKVGQAARFAIPIANWVENPHLSFAQRYRWTILDTFDALSPAYDSPQSEDEARQVLGAAGIAKLKRRDQPGLNLTGVKAHAATTEN
jgi:SAM-dependent methyltransferase